MSDPTPAIVRPFGDDDRDVDVMSEPYKDVHRSLGLGDSGKRIQIVKHECPSEHCSFDRMIRHWHVNPVAMDSVWYYCLSPNCPHYHDGEYDWAMPAPRAQEPTVNEQE